MQRIDGPYNVSAKPELSPAANAPGFFSGGDPQRGRQATRVTKDWLNWVQEEICQVIEEAGIKLDRADDHQLLMAIKVLIVSIDGSGGGDTGDSGKYKPLEPGDFEFFYRQSPPSGWSTAYGGVLVSADTTVPKLWAELQKPDKAWLLKSQAQWSAQSQSSPWNGIGGVPFFVLDIEARTIRLPDVRGMYMEATGFDSLTVGGVHGDAIRNISGSFANTLQKVSQYTFNTALFPDLGGVGNGDNGIIYEQETRRTGFDASRVVPVANVNRPRAFGTLPCVYVGGTK